MTRATRELRLELANACFCSAMSFGLDATRFLIGE